MGLYLAPESWQTITRVLSSLICLQYYIHWQDKIRTLLPDYIMQRLPSASRTLSTPAASLFRSYNRTNTTLFNLKFTPIRNFGSSSQTSFVQASKYSPWSHSFSGTTRTRVALQTTLCTLFLVGLTEYFIVCRLFVRELCISQEPSKQSNKATGTPGTTYASASELQAAINELRAAFRDPTAVITDQNDLKTYGSSEHTYHPASPHAVIVCTIIFIIHNVC